MKKSSQHFAQLLHSDFKGYNQQWRSKVTQGNNLQQKMHF